MQKALPEAHDVRVGQLRQQGRLFASLEKCHKTFRRDPGGGAAVVGREELTASTPSFRLVRYVTCQAAVGALGTMFRIPFRMAPFLVKNKQSRGSRPSTLECVGRSPLEAAPNVLALAS